MKLFEFYRVGKVKKLFGNRYSFEKFLPEKEVERLCRQHSDSFSDCVASSLTAGCVKIEAVLYQADGHPQLGYDVYVKDSPDSPEWIFYESPPDDVTLDEAGMLAVLDRVITENGLSYTECCFKRLDGISVNDKLK